MRLVSRPLDIQWAYVDQTRKLWNEARANDLLPHAANNTFLVARRRAPRADDGAAVLPASCLGDQHVLHKDAYFIPFRLYPSSAELRGLFGATKPRANLSDRALAYLSDLGLGAETLDRDALIWWHVLAIAYSPRYVADNPGGIAADWPRIPLPATADALQASAGLGRQLADLLDPLRPVSVALPSVVGPLRRVDGRTAQPALGHLDVTAQWGTVQRSGAVMPGRGKLVRRALTDVEQAAFGASAELLGLTCDIYLNDGSFWACVPERAWDFKIGGSRFSRNGSRTGNTAEVTRASLVAA